MIPRALQSQVVSALQRKKAVVILGARQVGKSTLVEHMAATLGLTSLILNCDESDVRLALTEATSTRLRQLIGSTQLLIIDEAQRVPNIGLSLKLIVDKIPDVRLLVTGSSALDLSSSISEPLTGRKYEVFLLPFSASELAATTSVLEEQRLLEHRLVYGLYPEIVTNVDHEANRLQQLASSYLYKDILSLREIRKPVALEKLLQGLALQLGSQVSYHELGRLSGLDKETVVRYLDLLEKCFVIYQLPSLSRNPRKELSKSRKVYFYDNGIRNAIIANFQPIALRSDKGALWENYLMAERIKLINNHGLHVNRFFWRSYSKQEVDYVEEANGNLSAFEFKWKASNRISAPSGFSQAYPEHSYRIVDHTDYWDFIATKPQ